MAQLPRSFGNRSERVYLDVEVQQVAMRCGRFERADSLGTLEAAKNVGRFDKNELRCMQSTLCEHVFRPFATWAYVYDGGDEHGSVDDDAHRRSASLERKMSRADTRDLAASLRRRTPSSHASIEGLAAILLSSDRRYSCIDLP